MATEKAELIKKMLVKIIVQNRKLKHALEQNRLLEDDLNKLKTLEEEIK